MKRYISTSLREEVAKRTKYLCEYCLIHEDDTYFGCEVDHIISFKHGGETNSDNLAYACAFCNRYKGSDIGSILIDCDEFIRFYNPRKDNWTNHFKLDGVIIEPISNIGEVTAKILLFNNDDRVFERKTPKQFERYPTSSALELLTMGGL